MTTTLDATWFEDDAVLDPFAEGAEGPVGPTLLVAAVVADADVAACMPSGATRRVEFDVVAATVALPEAAVICGAAPVEAAPPDAQPLRSKALPPAMSKAVAVRFQLSTRSSRVGRAMNLADKVGLRRCET